MIMKIFAVKDRKVEAFLQPFFSPTLGSAIRSLSEVLEDEKHTFSKHAADYVLYDLGEYDDATGCIAPGDIPSVICSLTDLKKVAEDPRR